MRAVLAGLGSMIYNSPNMSTSYPEGGSEMRLILSRFLGYVSLVLSVGSGFEYLTHFKASVGYIRILNNLTTF